MLGRNTDVAALGSKHQHNHYDEPGDASPKRTKYGGRHDGHGDHRRNAFCVVRDAGRGGDSCYFILSFSVCINATPSILAPDCK